MRTLSATLSSNQKAVGVDTSRQLPIWKIVLARDGQSTQTYTNTSVIEIDQSESEFSQTATVLIDNSGNALTSINFEMYKGVISWGYNDSSAGDEYSACAPLYVTGQRLYSAQGVLVCQLSLVGIPNLMAMDKAEADYEQAASNTNTAKTLMTAVVNKTLAPYTNYTSYTATYDSEDSLIDTFIPKDYFHVRINENRLEKAKQLLSWTGSKMRAEDDGKIHFFDPTISGSTYDYEYELNVSGEHTFFSKELRNRFVNPNKVIVTSAEGHDPSYSSSKTSATSYALFPKTETLRLRLASTAQALALATARIESYELNAETGAVSVPMNVGQEVWDWINATDSRQGDSRAGNVRNIRRHVKIPERRGRLIWDMDIRFGAGSITPFPIMAVGKGQGNQRVAIQSLIDAYFVLSKDLIRTIEKQNEIMDYLVAREERIPKLWVYDRMKIPVGTDKFG
ncbi:hypothetical protein LCGC14_0830300 [marine sediment metagenome]|uniref:Uncharacterized protein n=1 Tax=marine sediment metagenome TaxID=412755 RepID=A0A0F9Q1H4_9ZZZZ